MPTGCGFSALARCGPSFYRIPRWVAAPDASAGGAMSERSSAPLVASVSVALLLLVLVARRRSALEASVPGKGSPAVPSREELKRLEQAQAAERERNRQRGEQAERAWKDKPLGYEKAAEALASSYPLVKQALEAIFAGIRAVTTMPHMEQVADPLLDLENQLPTATREYLQMASLRVPYPFDAGDRGATVFSRQEYAGRALFREAESQGLVTTSQAASDQLLGLLQLAQLVMAKRWSATVFSGHDADKASLQVQLAAAWARGWDGQTDALDLVDRQHGANTEPNPDLGRTRLVLAIAQLEGQRARAAAPREANPFAT